MKRILVRLPNWLGDLLLARPLLHALRRAHPMAEIAGVAPGPLLELLDQDGVLDRSDAWPAGADRRTALAHALRAWGPDAALVLPPSFSSAWFARRTGAPRRIGYRHELRGPLLTEALARPPRGDLHLAREYLALGARLGVSEVAVPPLPSTEDARGRADAIRERAGLGQERLAILGPGARYGPAKRWPIERFVAVGRALDVAGWRVAVCGATDETREVRGVAEGIGPAAVVMAGAIDLPGLAALCALARLAVCNDSGLAHLAAAVGTRTIVVFGSTSSAWTAPLGPEVRVVQHAPVCSPCFQRSCRIGYACLHAVEAAQVLRAAEAA